MSCSEARWPRGRGSFLSVEPYADRPPTILVADDDSPSRALLKAFLQPEYREIEAVDGTSTLALVEGSRPDLVLLDVRMPAA
jgi:CheY-like chemotaxis protein